jgi:hypothetical protein
LSYQAHSFLVIGGIGKKALDSLRAFIAYNFKFQTEASLAHIQIARLASFHMRLVHQSQAIHKVSVQSSPQGTSYPAQVPPIEGETR